MATFSELSDETRGRQDLTVAGVFILLALVVFYLPQGFQGQLAAGFRATLLRPFLSTQEFLAQLANIYLHVAADFKTKCRETWMRESAITSRKVIRNPKKIFVEMDFFSLKKIEDSVISMAKCRIYDDQGGLFTARIKGLLR